ncbi:hypothetical protein ACFLSJ_01725 [Verrucomicrobiota bacterium]
MNAEASAQKPSVGRGERVVFYHPNQQGSGSAARLDPRMNQGIHGRPNCFFLEMAEQKAVAGQGNGGPARASFDWENKITVKLGFQDICHFLAVIEGRADHAGGKRDGLYHQNGSTNTLIGLKKNENGGYFLSLSQKRGREEESRRISTVLSDVEAVGLKHVLSVGLFFMALPMDACGEGRGEAQN